MSGHVIDHTELDDMYSSIGRGHVRTCPDMSGHVGTQHVRSMYRACPDMSGHHKVITAAGVTCQTDAAAAGHRAAS